MSDVDQLSLGHHQGEGGQVARTVHIRDIGAHVLQEGDRAREVTMHAAEWMDYCEGAQVYSTLSFSSEPQSGQ